MNVAATCYEISWIIFSVCFSVFCFSKQGWEVLLKFPINPQTKMKIIWYWKIA